MFLVNIPASLVQSLSRVRVFAIPGTTPARLPVHHHLLELAQTDVHGVSGALLSPCPLSSPSPPALNLSQHQGLF